jgi:putative flippase GtrA
MTLAHWTAIPRKYRRFVKFVLVGGLNTLFGYSVFAGLYLVGVPPHVAIVLATFIGVSFNFFSTGRLVFENSSWRKLLPFWFGYGVALGINLGMADLLIRAGLNPLLVQCLCLPVVVVVAYVINSRVVFRDTPNVSNQPRIPAP